MFIMVINNKKINKFKGIKIAYLVNKDEKDKYVDICDNMICNI